MRCVSECCARLYYLDGTVCSFGTCQAFVATQVAACRATAAHSAASAADGADEAERCYFVESVLGVRECEPKQLSATQSVAPRCSTRHTRTSPTTCAACLASLKPMLTVLVTTPEAVNTR